MYINAYHNKVTRLFFEDNYQNLINEHDLQELKQLKLLTGVDDKGKNIYKPIVGWVVYKNKYKYFLPEKINYKGEEVDIREVMPVKIKEVEQFSYFTLVYHKPKEGAIGVFKIPADKTMSFSEWWNGFAPFQHSNPRHFELYKGIILGSLMFRFNFRLATQPGFGKDSITSILRDLMPLDVSAYTPQSAPKLRTVLEKRLLVIDEIVDIGKDSMKLLEPVIRHAGDLRTVVENSALAVTGFTKDNYDISNLSLGFTYNEFADYKNTDARKDKSDKYFDHIFTKATQQRFFPLRLKGEIDVAQFSILNYNKEYLEHKEHLKNWIKMTKWLLDGGINILLEEKKEYVIRENFIKEIKSSRLQEHFKMIMQLFKLIAKSQNEFDGYCLDIINSYLDYQNMMEGM